MILYSQVKLENDNRSISIKRGVRARRRKVTGRVVSLRYIFKRNPRGRSCLVPDPIRAPIVQRIFHEVVDHGKGGYEVHQLLPNEGY